MNDDAPQGRSWLAELSHLFGRTMLLAAIAAIAYLRGYTARSWAYLGLAVLWAALLPLVFRGLWRLLAGSSLVPWQRWTLLALAALVLLGSFAVGLRYLVLPA